jgi:hypothetical protein
LIGIVAQRNDVEDVMIEGGKGSLKRREDLLVLQEVRRKVVLGFGILAVGILAVACSGAPQLTSTPGGFQASVGGFSVRLPDVTLPFVSSSPKPANSQTTTTTQSAVQGAVQSGEGCPIALPQ